MTDTRQDPAAQAPEVALPCPECRMAGIGGKARIGNRRNRCTTCNNFAQNVMRMTRKRLVEQHADEYRAIRARVEMDLYPQVIEDFRAVYPIPKEDTL